jgi:prepilin-type N-terminal cleavage/methylation domain-containing protein
MKRQGFSLLELVLVVAVVAVVLTIAVVGIRKNREAAARAHTTNNLKHIVLSIHGFNDAYRKLPPAYEIFPPILDFPASTHVYITPFIESSNFFREYRDNRGKGQWKNYPWPTFQAWDDPTASDGNGVQNYPANLRAFSHKGLNTKFDADMPALAEIEPGSASIPASFTRGTSTTILFATKYARCQDGGSRYAEAPNAKFAAFFGQNAARVPADPSDATATFQLNPNDANCLTSPLMAQSFSSSGISIGMADGSARFLSAGLSAHTWNLALQPTEKIELGDDW